MNNNNIEKILSMLQMEAIKARESEDLEYIEYIYLETQRFLKTEYKKLEHARASMYIERLNGQEEAEINNWLISYKPSYRFALDSAKLQDYCNKNNLDLKKSFYSHLIAKPSLKFKNIKK